MLGTGELPVHTHAIDHDHPSFNVTTQTSNNTAGANDFKASLNEGAGPASAPVNVPAFTGTPGNGGFANTAMNNMPPYLLANFIIKT